MLFGLPTSPGGWSLMILALRLIYIDAQKLNTLYARERARCHQTYNSLAIPLTLRLAFDFLSLFLAFNTLICGIGGIIVGLMVLESHFRGAEPAPKAEPAMTLVLRCNTHGRRWSQELKSLLHRDSSQTPTSQESNDTCVPSDGKSELSSETLPKHLELPSRPQSRLSKYASRHENRVQFLDFLDFKSPVTSPSPISLSPDSEDELDLNPDDLLPDSDSSVELPVLEIMELQVDDWVQLKGGEQGIIRFLGSRMSSATEWIGIEVIPDIAVNGAIAADWPSEAGVYVRPSAVERIIHRPQMDCSRMGMYEDSAEDDRPDWDWRRSTQSLRTLRTLESITEIPDVEGEEDNEEDTHVAGEHKALSSGIDIVDNKEQDIETSDINSAPHIWSKASDSTLIASGPFSGTSSPGDSHVSSPNLLDDETPPLPNPDIIHFESGLFSQRTSTEAGDEANDQYNRCSMCVEDTDEFEARMEMLVNGLDDILAATKRDLGRGDSNLRNRPRAARIETGSAEAPVVKDFRRTSFDVNGTVGLPGKLRRRWREWTKGGGQDEAVGIAS